MEFFRNTSYDFMGARKFFLPLSTILVLAAVLAVFVQGHLNIGIDFAGGTQLALRFAEKPDVQELRDLLEAEGLVEPLIQRFGEEELNEVLIKTRILEGSEEGSRRIVESALDRRYNPDLGDRLDVNKQGVDALAGLLTLEDPDGRRTAEAASEAQPHYDSVAEKIMEVRQRDGLLDSWDELKGIEEVSPAVLATLQEQAYLGNYAILGAENVGPQIGSELRLKGILAVAFSLIGMLIYIWLRFELRFGIGALVALTHDVLICLGLYALFGYEFNLTTIAAFLTVVGYSVNDSVVVFDRVRENLRRVRRESIESVLNLSINQTLSRTVLTSGTTLLAVTTLYFFGGDVIRGFSFVLMVGVLVGTYSSIFVAAPVVLYWQNLFGREAKTRRRSQATAAG